MSSTQDGALEELLIKQQYGQYLPTALLGKGQFGYVFSATDTQSRGSVALKVLNPFSQDPMARIEFEDEAHMLRKLTKCSGVLKFHSNGTVQLGAQVYGMPFEVPVPYMVLDQADGCLEEYILDDDVRGRLPWEDRLRFWRSAILGIHQMHLRKCIHRDIKCSNCLLFLSPANKKDLICVVGDLGKARDFGAPARLSPRDYMISRGDLRCASPEYLTWQGSDTWNAYRLADIYGIGSLFYELVMGQPITTVALGPSWDIVDATQRDALQGKFVDLASLRPRYGRAIQMLGLTAPPSIRAKLTVLMTQLCSPVPEERLPRLSFGRRGFGEPGLLWLLNRVDILSKMILVERRGLNRTGRGDR